MKVTVKGQVSIPHHIREKLGITPNTDVNFQEEGGERNGSSLLLA